MLNFQCTSQFLKQQKTGVLLVDQLNSNLAGLFQKCGSLKNLADYETLTNLRQIYIFQSKKLLSPGSQEKASKLLIQILSFFKQNQLYDELSPLREAVIRYTLKTTNLLLAQKDEQKELALSFIKVSSEDESPQSRKFSSFLHKYLLKMNLQHIARVYL